MNKGFFSSIFFVTNDAIIKLNLEDYCEILHSVPNIELFNNTPVSFYQTLLPLFDIS